MKNLERNKELREHATYFFKEGLKSVKAKSLIDKNLDYYDDVISCKDIRGKSKIFQLRNYENIYIIGAGKASAAMAEAIELKLTNRIKKGIVVAKYGFGKSLSNIICLEAGHPLPDENGIIATKKIVGICQNANEDDLIINIISGGASSLLISPVDEISLEDKIQATQALLNAGASIFELNTVRKHLSKIKGGKLTKIAYPATMINLIISDVINDDLNTIASGITTPDSSKKKDALKVLEKYDLLKKVRESVLKDLKKAEVNKLEKKQFEKNYNFIIGNNSIAIDVIKKLAQESGYKTEIGSTKISGEAKNAGKELINKIYEYETYGKYCVISGGETTVTVKGKGKGGRNQELCLSAAIECSSDINTVLLSAGTDGNDGNTNAAGAICDNNTIARADKLGLSPSEYLNRNDSYNFFRKLDDLIITGPTETNVMDIQILLFEKN